MMLYRKEIDGLRAVAVLAVMFFHADVLFFRGGFVGVDVFFVISGYLITQIILAQAQHGSFSLVSFYDRRARRILPALFAMMFVCLPAAWLILMNPADFKDFSKSLLAIPLFVSNILFWRESGYFDLSTHLKPLLHTWSLAVEEQYYVFFPVYLVALWKLGSRWALGLTCILALLSLAFAQWGSLHVPTFNFYWLPARIWELLAGALIPIFNFAKNPLAPFPGPRSGTVAQVLGMSGLILVAWSIFMMAETILWPGMWTLVPVSGTVLILIFASDKTLAGTLLGIKPMAAMGLISYSAYLWHQPLLAFARYLSDDLSIGLLIALLTAAVVLGWLSWKFVETPFRDRQKFTTKQIFVTAIACSVFFVSVGLTGYFRAGFLYRLPSQNEPVFTYTMQTFMRDIRGDTCFIQNSQFADHYETVCSQTNHPEDATLIWGDSHAAALLKGFQKQISDVMQFTAGSCAPIFWKKDESPSCRALNQYAMQQIQRIRPRTIYLHANWLGYVPDQVAGAAAIRQIREWIPGVRIVLIGNIPHWPKGLPRVVLQSGVNFDGPVYFTSPLFSQLTTSDQQLAEFAQQSGIQFVSALDLLCRQDACLAVTLTDLGPRLTAFDYGHLTEAGSDHLVRALLNQ